MENINCNPFVMICSPSKSCVPLICRPWITWCTAAVTYVHPVDSPAAADLGQTAFKANIYQRCMTFFLCVASLLVVEQNLSWMFAMHQAAATGGDFSPLHSLPLPRNVPEWQIDFATSGLQACLRLDTLFMYISRRYYSFFSVDTLCWCCKLTY